MNNYLGGSIVSDENQASIQNYRLQQSRRRLSDSDCSAVVLFDPINIRYATGTRNMQVWTLHNICRYAVIFESGEVVLFFEEEDGIRDAQESRGLGEVYQRQFLRSHSNVPSFLLRVSSSCS